MFSKYLILNFPCKRCGKLFKTRNLEKVYCDKCVIEVRKTEKDISIAFQIMNFKPK